MSHKHIIIRAAYNRRFGNMVAGRWQFRHFIAVVLQSRLDGFQFGFCLLASAFVFLFGGGSGRTIFKFHHIAKP